MTEFQMYEYLSAHCVVYSTVSVQLFAYLASHILCADEACKINRSLVKTGKLLGAYRYSMDVRTYIICVGRNTRRVFRSRLASFNVSPVWLGALCGRPLSNGINW